MRQQALFESSQSLTDGEYLAQMEGLRAPRRQAVNEVMERLTEQDNEVLRTWISAIVPED